MRYEVTFEQVGPCPQLGWATPGFELRPGVASHNGVGDLSDSWAVDGVRGVRFHNGQMLWDVFEAARADPVVAPAARAAPFWRAGDVIGVAADLDAGQLWFGRNGEWWLCFDGGAGIYPALSVRDARFELNCGERPFRYPPPLPEDGRPWSAANAPHASSSSGTAYSATITSTPRSAASPSAPAAAAAAGAAAPAAATGASPGGAASVPVPVPAPAPYRTRTSVHLHRRPAPPPPATHLTLLRGNGAPPHQPTASASAAAAAAAAAAAPAAAEEPPPLRVGDTVRVRAGVTAPAYGWGALTPSSVGTILTLDGADCTADFAEHNSWHGLCADLERVSPRTADDFPVGTLVRVLATSPEQAWKGLGSGIQVIVPLRRSHLSRRCFHLSFLSSLLSHLTYFLSLLPSLLPSPLGRPGGPRLRRPRAPRVDPPPVPRPLGRPQHRRSLHARLPRARPRRARAAAGARGGRDGRHGHAG